MKNLFAIITLILLLPSCATTGKTDQSSLDKQLERKQKLYIK